MRETARLVTEPLTSMPKTLKQPLLFWHNDSMSHQQLSVWTTTYVLTLDLIHLQTLIQSQERM